jgi:hypothetical protein
MSTGTFDTHSYFKRLTDNGVTPAVAEVQLSVMSDWIASQDLRAATKQDLTEVSRELRSEMKLEVAQLKASIVWSMLGFALAQVALIVGLIHALH